MDPHVIVTDSNERAKQLMNTGLTKSLHSIVITSENIHQETEDYAKSRNVKLYPFTEVEVSCYGRFTSFIASPKTLAYALDIRNC